MPSEEKISQTNQVDARGSYSPRFNFSQDNSSFTLTSNKVFINIGISLTLSLAFIFTLYPGWQRSVSFLSSVIASTNCRWGSEDLRCLLSSSVFELVIRAEAKSVPQDKRNFIRNYLGEKTQEETAHFLSQSKLDNGTLAVELKSYDWYGESGPQHISCTFDPGWEQRISEFKIDEILKFRGTIAEYNPDRGGVVLSNCYLLRYR